MNNDLRVITKEYIQNPDKKKWSWWPLLPVKRQISNDAGIRITEVGLILANLRNVVFLWNLFMVPAKPTVKDFLEYPQIKYKDTNELINDGWLID